ncbi:Hypothetical predicted protein, partial [Paramuricea clavata]
MDDDKNSSEWSRVSNGSHMLGVITIKRGNIDVNRTFCMKQNTGIQAKFWPIGSYCIYKKGTCPKDMTSGWVFWDDEDANNINKYGGFLPDGVYDKDTQIEYCCQTDGNWYDSIELPVSQPFYLLTSSSTDSPKCQMVKWAFSYLEYIVFDTEDSNNRDAQGGEHLFVEGRKLFYCYYEECRRTMTSPSGSFRSRKAAVSEMDPRSQYCSWLITLAETYNVSLSFKELTIPSCNDTFLRIYDGSNNTAPLLGTYCGSNASTEVVVLSSTNSLYIVSNSGSYERSAKNTFTFHAQYQAKNLAGDEWPSGSYGLPRPKSGCPGGTKNVWREGWRYQDMDDDENSSEWSRVSNGSHMLGVITIKRGNIDVNRTFCMKQNTGIQAKFWPKGSYCIYKNGTCPKDMASGWVFWDDEDRNNINKIEGFLPDGSYDKDTQIEYCCQTDGHWYDSIELPVSRSFYLLTSSSTDTPKCQMVKWAFSYLEYIVFDTEDSNNRDAQGGEHLFVEGRKLFYCYYEECRRTMTSPSGSFRSHKAAVSEMDPRSQYCSWLITLAETYNVSLSFKELTIPSCNDTFLRIYDGSNNTAPLLGTYCGSNASTEVVVLSSTNSLYIVSNSGSYERSAKNTFTFHVQYHAKNLAGDEWPSGSYGLPRPKSGCPGGKENGWREGWRYQDMQDAKNSSEWSRVSNGSHMLGAITVKRGNRDVNRTFCMKQNTGIQAKFWPKGSYCIYKSAACPNFMTSGWAYWDDEDGNNINRKGGFLPDGVYDRNTKIYYCCQTDGNWYDSIELPVSQPFYLLTSSSTDTPKCQMVKWAFSYLEYIVFDTEDSNNRDAQGGEHLFVEGRKLFYCYYEECRRTMTGPISGSFRLHKAAVDEMDPRSQYCSWLITLAGKYIILLSFKELFIPSCKDTFLRIYDGSNNTAPLLGTYCGSNASTEVVILSSTNNLYIVSNSGSYERCAKKFFTFHAQYNATNSTVKEKTGSTIIIIATTAGCVVFLCIVLIVLLITYKRRKRASKLSTPVNIQLADATPKESLPIGQEPVYETVDRVNGEFYNDIGANETEDISAEAITSDYEEVGPSNVKEDSDYVIPAHERIESSKDMKMGRNVPDYEPLDLSKREADDYQKLASGHTKLNKRPDTLKKRTTDDGDYQAFLKKYDGYVIPAPDESQHETPGQNKTCEEPKLSPENPGYAENRPTF